MLLVFLPALLHIIPANSGRRSGEPLSRRTAVTRVAAAVCVPLTPMQKCNAEAFDDARSSLLAAIARDSGVEAAIEALVPLDPSGGKGATSPALEGRWRLLWSANAGGFSPLLLLPTPVRPTSFQLLGDAAVSDGIGPGRVAQLLLLPFGTVELSSDVVPAPDDTRFLEIFPPFKLQLRLYM